MTTWNPRHLPYPLLAPWNDDYGDNTFGAIVPQAVLNNGAEISFTIKYNLTSRYIRGLIAEGKANYVALVTCSKTSSRNAYITKQQDEDVHVLNASDYSEEFRLFPYVVAMQQINGFISDEHAEEFKQFKPDGFDIAPASILAVGQGSRIVLEEGGSPYSVIDLVSDPKIENGLFKVDLDEQRIKIHVSPNDKKRIEALRDRRHSAEMYTLFPAIYLHAITEALRNLSEHTEAGWASTIEQSLAERNIAEDDYEELRINALTYAQQLLAKPVGTLLTAFMNKEED